MIYLTEEQAQQIEEALLDTLNNNDYWLEKCNDAIATIRAARAQDIEEMTLTQIAAKSREPACMKLYCSTCDKVQPANVGECRDAKTGEPYQDIVCSECCLVIASGTGVKPVKQAPAITERQFKLAMKQWDDWKAYALELQERLTKYEGGSPMLLNAAPIRTKDLTDDEIADIVYEMNGNEPTAPFWRDLANAVIAADREKNRV